MSTPNRKWSIEEGQLDAACAAAKLSDEQTVTLKYELTQRAAKPNTAMWFYIVAGAIGLPGALLIAAWLGASLDAGSSAIAAASCAALFIFGGNRFNKHGARVPAGLAYIMASVLSLGATIAFEAWLFRHSGDYNGAILLDAIVVAAVSGVLTWRSGIAFVSTPALVAGAAFVVALSNLMSGETLSFGSNFHTLQWALLLYGLALNQLCFWVDGKTQDDYSFWGYIVGVLSFWVGVALIDKGELGWAVCGLTGLVSIGVSVYRQRAIFAVAGVAAILSWVFHADSRLFDQDMLGFGVSLTALSIAIAWVGAWYWKNADRINAWLRARLPIKN